ncbi:MAG: methyltransferase domain-containing protein [Anaerolineaceae bacterium]|nr:methyltransferase domain-containing protein [Anaerolineaceae bacterium]
MKYLREIEIYTGEFAAMVDEVSLWSAPFILKILERIPIRSGVSILDVGAGTGLLTVELAQRCGSGSSVIAVDPWDLAIKRLQFKIDTLQLKNIQLIPKSLEESELIENSIDLIVSNLGINNFEKPDTVLEKCFQVSKPGANLIVTTNLTGHMQEFYDILLETMNALG